MNNEGQGSIFGQITQIRFLIVLLLIVSSTIIAKWAQTLLSYIPFNRS